MNPGKIDKQLLSRLKVEPLDRNRHNRAAFSCGVDRVDNFLRNTAVRQQDHDFTKGYVAIEPPDNQVLGYYALNAHAIDASILPAPLDRNLPRYPTISAIYLSTIGVDRTLQRCGVGSFLMADALKLCVTVADKIGAHMVVLDALNEDAARMYRRIGFIDLSSHPLRMLMPMARLRKAVQAAADTQAAVTP